VVAKKAKKTSSKTKSSTGAAKVPDVIATIIETISRERGATAEEMLAVLVKAFPDREPAGHEEDGVDTGRRELHVERDG
jgi:hypothetical protein